MQLWSRRAASSSSAPDSRSLTIGPARPHDGAQRHALLRETQLVSARRIASRVVQRRGRLRALLALLDRAAFCGTRQRLAVFVHRRRLAAPLYAGGLGCARECLAILVDRLADASILRPR